MVSVVLWAQCIHPYILQCQWLIRTGKLNQKDNHFFTWTNSANTKTHILHWCILPNSFYNCSPMTAMSSFSHHHHHHHHPPPPPPPNGPLSISPNLTGLPPSNTTTASIVSNNNAQQCLQQSAAQQQQQHLQRDIISPSPYQCHMSVRHSPCSPSQGVSSVYQMNGSSPAAYGTSNTPNGGTTGKYKLIFSSLSFE